jgi:hypothetical protein
MSFAWNYDSNPGTLLQRACEWLYASWYPPVAVTSPFPYLKLNTSRMYKAVLLLLEISSFPI